MMNENGALGHGVPPVVGIEALTHSTTERTQAKRGVGGEPWRVAAVIPGYGREKDLELLFRDLARLDVRGITLWTVLVDNNSPRALSGIQVPDGLVMEHHRLSENTGGAGGFNAGMARVLSGEGLSGQFEAPDFVWLLDSDVRLHRKCLWHLVRVLVKHKRLCAAGSALVDPVTRMTYEIGGKMEKRWGFFVPASWGDPDRRKLVKADYLAACSTLVRREAIEKTGLMPEVFIHGDDVEWFLQMTRKTGMKVAGVPKARAAHPLWSRKFQTWVRYYTTRNAYAPIDVVGFGAMTRLRRALVDVARAMGQAIMGFDELAELHLRGLEDAAEGRTVGHGVPGGLGPIIAATKVKPFGELAGVVRELQAGAGPDGSLWVHPLLAMRAWEFRGLAQAMNAIGAGEIYDAWWDKRAMGGRPIGDMAKALVRAILRSQAGVAIVPTGQPSGWFRGRVSVQVTPEGFLVRETARGERLGAAYRVLRRGLRAAMRVAHRPRMYHALPKAPGRAQVRIVQGAIFGGQEGREERVDIARKGDATVSAV